MKEATILFAETVACFEMPTYTTVNRLGDKTVNILAAGCEKQQFNVMLATYISRWKVTAIVSNPYITKPTKMKFSIRFHSGSSR